MLIEYSIIILRAPVPVHGNKVSENTIVHES